jgi:integrative and conjugative element protein (TIGR02256 family)
MDDFEFWSEDRRFGLLVPGNLLEELYSRCKAAGRTETGSILVGHYRRGNTLAVVTDLPETPPDSIAGATYFDRGTRGLRRLLKRLWRKERYYLGEWHYHPGAAAHASPQDHRQMREAATSDRYHCPEPVLMIIGGSAPEWEVSAHVYPSGAPLRINHRP